MKIFFKISSQKKRKKYFVLLPLTFETSSQPWNTWRTGWRFRVRSQRLHGNVVTKIFKNKILFNFKNKSLKILFNF